MHIPDVFSWIGSLLAMLAFLQGVLPSEYRDYLVDGLLRFCSPYTYFIIPEFDGVNTNELYVHLQFYLSAITAKRAQVSQLLMPKNAKAVSFSLANNQRIRDTFNNVTVEWQHKSQERRNNLWVNWDNNSDERRSFHVKMPRDKKYVLDSYISHIVQKAKELQRASRDLQLYSNKRNDRGGKCGWSHIPFLHPANFDTIALDPEVKSRILEDLEEFVNAEDFYRRVGKAWKRGYLLYGPPGTGKSSIIAAMANKLRYDVYDLELTEVQSNAELRQLLLHTSNKSIVVIEDIDCSLDLSGQRKKKIVETAPETAGPAAPPAQSGKDKDNPSRMTLSGLLNFTDGLWSSCGEERIFIFTTNFIKKLDPALLRPGRMDMHIHLTYCIFPAFKTLARNFLQIQDHHRFPEVEMEMTSSFMTPAEVAEILTVHKRDEDLAMKNLIMALRQRKTKPPSHEETQSDEEREGESDEKPESTDAKTDKSPKPDTLTNSEENSKADGSTTSDASPTSDS